MRPGRELLALELARLSDADLLELANGEVEAFATFYRRHQAAIVAYLWRQTGNEDVARELAAETFAVAFDESASYDRRRGDGRGWLFGIAKITLLASYRRRGVEQTARQKLGLTVAGHSEADWEEAEARLDASTTGLVAGLGALGTAEREAVIARIVDERDYADIARETNASEAAVRQRVSRGLAKLAQTIKRGAAQ